MRTATFVTNEPIALKLAGVKTRTFAAANYCFHFYDDVMFTTSGLIKSNPALVKKVVNVSRHAGSIGRTRTRTRRHN